MAITPVAWFFAIPAHQREAGRIVNISTVATVLPTPARRSTAPAGRRSSSGSRWVGGGAERPRGGAPNRKAGRERSVSERPGFRQISGTPEVSLSLGRPSHPRGRPNTHSSLGHKRLAPPVHCCPSDNLVELSGAASHPLCRGRRAGEAYGRRWGRLVGAGRWERVGAGWSRCGKCVEQHGVTMVVDRPHSSPAAVVAGSRGRPTSSGMPVVVALADLVGFQDDRGSP